MKEWRKILISKKSQRLFINIRKSELFALGFNKINNLLYRTKIERPNKIILEIKGGEESADSNKEIVEK